MTGVLIFYSSSTQIMDVRKNVISFNIRGDLYFYVLLKIVRVKNGERHSAHM